MIRVGQREGATPHQPSERDQLDRVALFSRAGLFWRSLAVFGAFAGSAVGAADLAASSPSQPSPAHDREISGLALLIARLQAAFYAQALKAGHLTGEAHQFADVVGARSAHMSNI